VLVTEATRCLLEHDAGFLAFEVSAFGGFRGLQQACGIDAAPLVAGAVLRRLAAR
jgi:ribosomal protein S6--L-glutamate ligase